MSASLTWFDGRVSGAAEQFCETPRHETAPPRTDYTVLLNEDGAFSVWGSCRECLAIMAADLGTTPEASAQSAVPDRIAEVLRRTRAGG